MAKQIRFFFSNLWKRKQVTLSRTKTEWFKYPFHEFSDVQRDTKALPPHRKWTLEEDKLHHCVLNSMTGIACQNLSSYVLNILILFYGCGTQRNCQRLNASWHHQSNFNQPWLDWLLWQKESLHHACGVTWDTVVFNDFSLSADHVTEAQ